MSYHVMSYLDSRDTIVTRCAHDIATLQKQMTDDKVECKLLVFVSECVCVCCVLVWLVWLVLGDMMMMMVHV